MGDTIIGVQFGIANPEEILSRSVVEVITEKPSQSRYAAQRWFRARKRTVTQVLHGCRQLVS